jgi:hypothetical protein
MQVPVANVPIHYAVAPVVRMPERSQQQKLQLAEAVHETEDLERPSFVPQRKPARGDTLDLLA